MNEAGDLIRRSLWKAWDGYWLVILAEICWLVLSLLVVTVPAAVAGMYYSMHQLACGESVDWKTFFQGAWRYAWAGYRWFGANLLVVGTLALYMWWFTSTGASWSSVATGVAAGLILVWGGLQIYTFPFMLSQEKPSYRTALRNSLVFFLKWPVYSFGLVFFNLIIIALSTLMRFPWVFLTFSLTALIACNAVLEKTRTPSAEEGY